MNIGNLTLNLTGVRFTAGINYDFASGTMLPPGGRLVIARDRNAFLSRHATASGNLATGFFLNGTALNNSGDRLVLIDAASGVIKDFSYDDNFPWPAFADGEGASLVLIAPLTNPDPAVPANWRSSVPPGGSPGGSDATFFTGDPALDADHDGLTAFLEYAIGTSDDDPNMTSGVSAALDPDGHLLYKATRNLSADDVIYEPQLSSDLSAWSSSAFALIAEDPATPGLTTLTWRSLLPVSTRAFTRLSVKLR
jgi:hypothetical protein